MIKQKGHSMEVHESIVSAAVIGVSGAITWVKSGLNKVSDRQTKLELNVAEKHLSKDDTEKMILLMNAPTIQSLNQVTKAVENLDTKIDRLLDRGDSKNG